jgi:MobA/MobL family
MESYFLRVKIFSRGRGSSATKSAAYRAGERIRDERTSAVHDYTDRTDVLHAEIVLPAEYDQRVDMDWARNRSTLWNSVEHAGRHCNSRLAREVLVLLPAALTPTRRTDLIRAFSRELAERYRAAVDFALHAPRASADQRHHHAHLLMTARQVGPDGLGARTILELSGTERHERGLGPSKEDLLWIRKRWAEVANEALRSAGVSARIDHRSYQDQGIDREPKPFLPRTVFYGARHSSGIARVQDEIQARYRERVEARLKGPQELARVMERQRAEGLERAIRTTAGKETPKAIPNGALTREQLNEKRRARDQLHRQEINRKQRERRRANAEEVNRKQREYLQRRRGQEKERAAHLPGQAVKSTSAEKTSVAARVPGEVAESTSAEQSVKNWLAYRAREKPTAAPDPVNEWLAFREAQRPATSATAAEDRSAKPGRKPRARIGEAEKDHPGTKNDHTL